MSVLPLCRTRLAFVGALLVLGCSVVDPLHDLKDYPDDCVLDESCADGFSCVQRRCVVSAGALCVEGFTAVPCERSAGVCAGAERACVDGSSEVTCTVASYGARYEEDETSCVDGLDNDCDGFPEVRRSRKLEVAFENARLGRSSVDTQVVRFGPGFLAVWVDDLPARLGNDAIVYRRTDAALRPHPPAAALDRVSNTPATRTRPDGTTYDVYSAIDNLQVVAIPSGALVLWDVFDANTDARSRRVARLDMGASPTEAVVGLAPRDLPSAMLEDAAALRVALSQDNESVLLVWRSGGVVRGQAFGLDLVARSEPTVLSAPLAEEASLPQVSHAAIAASDSSDFVVGWSITPIQSGVQKPLRFRKVSATLDTLGEVTGADTEGSVSDLRLLPGTEGAPAVAAWLEMLAAPSNAAGEAAARLVLAQPFVSDQSLSPPVELPASTARLHLVRDGDGVLLVHPEAATPEGTSPRLMLRRLGSDGSSQARLLGVVPTSLEAPVSILLDAEAGFTTVIFTANGRAQLSSGCQL